MIQYLGNQKDIIVTTNIQNPKIKIQISPIWGFTIPHKLLSPFLVLILTSEQSLVPVASEIYF